MFLLLVRIEHVFVRFRVRGRVRCIPLNNYLIGGVQVQVRVQV